MVCMLGGTLTRASGTVVKNACFLKSQLCFSEFLLLPTYGISGLIVQRDNASKVGLRGVGICSALK